MGDIQQLFESFKIYYDQFNQQSIVSKKYDNVVLITYASGRPIYYLNQMLLAKSAHDHGIDRIVHYSPNDIDTKFYQANKKILAAQRGGGYWLWKPYIILEAMNRFSENTIILYLDTDCYIKPDIDPLINLVEQYERVL
ncbi:MAG: hypothetical protein EOP33_03140 [Rickettsiaceae bacterium]|nr:MAG: hypothetical protein EOP33_03140 [Rickettsiaceae bacterium]